MAHRRTKRHRSRKHKTRRYRKQRGGENNVPSSQPSEPVAPSQSIDETLDKTNKQIGDATKSFAGWFDSLGSFFSSTQQPETQQPETQQPETQQPETQQPETQQPPTGGKRRRKRRTNRR